VHKAPHQTPGSPAPAETFGRFQLVERIGKGGMAEVFRAVASGLPGFERSFVIKRIRPDRSDSPKFVQMFCEEARITSLLHHPSIVRVFEFGQIEGAYFMVMEHLRGKDLSTVMRALRGRREAMPPSLAAFVARQVARALDHAHTLVLPDGLPGGIIHRDVTPSNIMLLESGGVKILDFGIARAATLARAQNEPGKAPRLAGKLSYMSPELVRGAPVDHRTDIFSLGIALWEMVAGERLFSGDNDSETLRNVLTKPIAEPSRRRDGVPARLDAIVAKALDRDPAARYETAAAFAEALDRFLVEMPAAEEAIPKLLEEAFSAPTAPKRVDPNENPSATYFSSGPATGPSLARGTGSRAIYRTIPPPRAPRIPLLALFGIFAVVVSVVVTVGRFLLRR
jgi:serine/threonine protein kinase